MKRKIIIVVLGLLMLSLFGCTIDTNGLKTQTYIFSKCVESEKYNIKEIEYNKQFLEKYFSEEKKYYIINNYEEYNEIYQEMYGITHNVDIKENHFDTYYKVMILRVASSSNEIPCKYIYNDKENIIELKYISTSEIGDTAMYDCIDIIDVPKNYKEDIFENFFKK